MGCSELRVIPTCSGLIALKKIVHVRRVTGKCVYILQSLYATVISKDSGIYVSLVSEYLRGKKSE